MPVIQSFNLSPEQLNSYAELQKAPKNQAYGQLANILGLQDYEHDTRSAVALDLVAAIIEQCHKVQLGAQQTSAVLHIGQQLLQCCADGASRDQAQQLLRTSLLELCSATPAAKCDAGSAGGLSPDAISAVAAAFVRGILQHYFLYTLVFTQEQAHVQHQFHLPVESAVPAAPLAQALSEPDWQAHRAADQAAREAEQAAAAAAEKAAKEAEEAARIAWQKAEAEAARQEQLQRKPKTLGEAVEKLVALRLEDVQHTLTAAYTAKAAALVAKVAQLEQQQQVQQQQLQAQHEQQQAATAHTAAKPGSNKGSRAGSAVKATQ